MSPGRTVRSRVRATCGSGVGSSTSRSTASNTAVSAPRSLVAIASDRSPSTSIWSPRANRRSPWNTPSIGPVIEPSARRPRLSGRPEGDDGILQERLAARDGHPLTAPSLVFMMRFWKTKNITATGIVMIAAAASLTGYCVPWLSCPDAREATPLVSVVRSGDCVETMKWLSSFQDPLERQDDDGDQRRAGHGQHDRPEHAEGARAVDARLLLDRDGDRLEEVLHDEHARRVHEQRHDHARVGVVDAELVEHQELRDQQHHCRARP